MKVKKLSLEKKQCLCVGIITKTHGVTGAMILDLDIEFSEIQKQESVLVEIDQILVPFFFAYAPKLRNNYSAFVYFDDIDNQDKAKFFIAKQVFVPKSELNAIENKAFELADFLVVDQTKGTIGKVDTILQIPKNELLRIISPDDIEILIPFQQDIIQSIDSQKQILYIDAPEGLIDLYLEN